MQVGRASSIRRLAVSGTKSCDTSAELWHKDFSVSKISRVMCALLEVMRFSRRWDSSQWIEIGPDVPDRDTR